MGLDADRAPAAIRLSVGRWTTEANIDSAAGQLASAAIRLAGPAAGRGTPPPGNRMTTTQLPV